MRKIRAASAYLDILIHRRLWNSRRIAQSQLRYPLFDLAKRIRHQPLEVVVDILTQEANEDRLDFHPNVRFRLNRRNSSIVRRILARLTLFVENKRPGAPTYLDLLRTGSTGFDIEHVLPSTTNPQVAGFDSADQFEDDRNWIGGLLLVPSRVNRSLGDMSYSEKREYYLKENLLAASLHPLAYSRDPQFAAFCDSSGLPFKSIDDFDRSALGDRQSLYEQLAELVWSPDRIRAEAEV